MTNRELFCAILFCCLFQSVLFLAPSLPNSNWMAIPAVVVDFSLGIVGMIVGRIFGTKWEKRIHDQN
jgi:hypothetical protein